MEANIKVLFLTVGFLCICAMVPLAVSCNNKVDNKVDEEVLRLYVNAHDLYTQGRFEETSVMLNSVRDFPAALTLRAKAEYFSGELEQAEKSCRRVLKLRPSSVEARLYLARILRDRGEQSAAERIAESLLADNPQDIRTLRLAAGLAHEQGKLSEALALLDRTAELSAESAMALLDRARLRWIAGRGTEALEDLSRARAMLPWNTPLVQSIEHLEAAIREVSQ
jgi:tetratricopeptide (TPR) repeat protein